MSMKQFTVLALLGQIFLRAVAQVTIADAGSFIVGSEVTVICEIQPYSVLMNWKIDSVVVAECILSTCSTTSDLPGHYSFSENTGAGIFNLTISPVQLSDNGSVLLCENENGDDSLAVTVQAADQTTPSSDKWLSVGANIGIIVGTLIGLVLCVSAMCICYYCITGTCCWTKCSKTSGYYCITGTCCWTECSKTSDMGIVTGRAPVEPSHSDIKDLTDIPWRDIKGDWTTSFPSQLLMEEIKSYGTGREDHTNPGLLFLGPTGAGKTSFINSICSIGENKLVNKASKSNTVSFTRYKGEGLLENFRLCDTIGLEEVFHVSDVVNLIKGHMKNTYKFNNRQPFIHGSPHYNPRPKAEERTQCVIFVIDALVINLGSLSDDMKKTIKSLHDEIKLHNIPQVLILTKVDLLCQEVADDIQNLFRSTKVQNAVEKASEMFEIPKSNIHPVKNYKTEINIDSMVNIPLLLALQQIVHLISAHYAGYDEYSSSDSSSD